jgi:hypothetical protein
MYRRNKDIDLKKDNIIPRSISLIIKTKGKKQMSYLTVIGNEATVLSQAKTKEAE